MIAGRRKRKIAEVNDTNLTNAELAESMMDQRTTKSTKGAYAIKIRGFIEWCQTHQPQALENDRVIIPIDVIVVKEFFGYLTIPAHRRNQLQTPNEVPDDEDDPPSCSTLSTYRSALVSLYTKENKKMSEELTVQLKTILDGYEKTINELRKKGLIKISEGKKPLKMKGYQLIALKFMTKNPVVATRICENWNISLMCWSFLLMMWNLMSRSDSIQSLLTLHLDWEEDAMIVEEQGHKGDQTGSEKFWKHVYANPLQPWICPILAYAVYTFADRNQDVPHEMFLGTDTKGSFNYNLGQLVKSFTEEELLVLGCEMGDIGTHSCRTGASTYCSGFDEGPSPVTIRLRMGNIGSVQDKYSAKEPAADQLCGRTICGLPRNSVEFDILPPHFDTATSSLLTSSFWSTIISGYQDYPAGFKRLLPFLLASLLYHHEYLKSVFQSNHPVFLSPVFTRNTLLTRLKEGILLGYGRCPNTGMIATGVPRSLVLARQIVANTQQLQVFNQRLDTLENKLEIHFPTLNGNHLCSEIRQNLTIEGATPVTLRDLDSFREGMINEFTTILASHMPPPSVVTQVENEENQTSEGPFKIFQWNDGKIGHKVPKGWTFPKSLNTKIAWGLWYYGDLSTGICPLQHISREHDLTTEADKTAYTRISKVMNFIENIMTREDLLPPNVSSITDLPPHEAEPIFSTAIDIMITELYQTKLCRRKETVSVGTLYNLINKRYK